MKAKGRIRTLECIQFLCIEVKGQHYTIHVLEKIHLERKGIDKLSQTF